mmetsp:Transcript_4648/g.6172  ORF Transcript_4648/g.6172 Transcript_4648/m.6172 type:complete len:228 (-) Transcript_4648:1011-1694(-)
MGVPAKLVKGTRIGGITTFSSYQLEFNLIFTGVVGGWSNILHITATGGNCCNQGDRLPGIWAFSGTTRLHIRTASGASGNDGCDPTQQIGLNKMTAVKVMVMSNWQIQVFFDKKKVCDYTMKGALYPEGKPASSYVSDPWYPASNAVVTDVKYTKLAPVPTLKPTAFPTGYPTSYGEFSPMVPMQLKQGLKLGDIKTHENYQLTYLRYQVQWRRIRMVECHSHDCYR